MVYLVGAGAGDVELLTLQAFKILKKAEVVLYDALVNPEILKLCKQNTILINVGKRKGKHLSKQEEINALLIKYGASFSTVIRLKGGTPFVFGRGYEEVRALKKAYIEVKVLSGVSSTTAVPESFMIPLVDREFNDSYRTITGHNIEVFNAIVTHYIPRENLVIMMGVYNLKAIVTSLLKKGFPKKTPLAILSKGTTSEASKIVLTLETITQKNENFFDEIKALTPAIIFVGNTIDVI